MKAPRHLEKEAHAQRKTAARARRMMSLVPNRNDHGRIRRFADECEQRATALECQIKALRRSLETGARAGTPRQDDD